MKIPVKIYTIDNELPEYKTEKSSGCDLRAKIKDPILLGPNCRATIPTGKYIALPDNYEAQVRPRSGLVAEHGVAASLGTIDNDYRGEIKVTLINQSNEDFRVEPGMRIAQLVIASFVQADWTTVSNKEELGETKRGSQGFGSTGLK